MKFNLENGLYCVQSGYFSNKIWTQITPFFICSSLLKAPKYPQTQLHFNNDAYFLDFRLQNIPLISFLLNLNPF